jgi:hypothetical protein
MVLLPFILIGGLINILKTPVEESPKYFIFVMIFYIPILVIVRRKQLNYSWKEIAISIIPIFGQFYINNILKNKKNKSI